MKKLLSFLLVACFSVTLFAQTYLVQNFDGSSMPTGWTVLNNPSNWSISNTNTAGGTPRELKLTWTPAFNGKSRVMSPVIDLTGVSDLVIEFLQYLDNFSGSHTIGIETTSNGGTTWNLAFQKTFNSTQGSKITEIITTSDVGSPTFQFCLFYQGNSYNINDWYFDNFLLFGRYNNDATISTVNAVTNINNVFYYITGNNTVNVTVSNVGMQTINTIEMKYQVNDETPVIETFTSFNLQTLTSKTVSFSQPAHLNPGNSTLKVEVLTVNGVIDDNPLNDIFNANLNVATQEGVRRVCIEHFTSSTCGPCVNVNIQMKNLLNNPANADKFGITKYQMSWPAPGDPYYTAEGGVRRTYYSVNAVPMVFFNAKNNNVNQTVFNNALAEPAFVDITGHFSISGNNIIITGEVLSYINMPAARLYVVVNEKRTTGNVGNNGELEFFHVMMKMLPNANGQTVALTAGASIPFQHTFDMSSTKVEEMHDLEVHVFLQEYDSKYIFNSNFLSDQPPIPEPTNLAAQQVNQDVLLTWEGDADSYKLYFNGILLQENITSKSFSHVNVPVGEHVYGLRAVVGTSQSGMITTSIAVCGEEPENLIAERVNNSVVLTWDADYVGTYSFKVFFNGNQLAENIKTKTYTHQNVPGGNHTYGVLAVVGECAFNVVEKSIEICKEPKNLEGQVDNYTVNLSWVNDYGAITLFFDGDMLEENINESTFTHNDVPVGVHTYGIKAVGIDCETEIIETTVEIVLGINDYDNKIKIYPNPANDFIFIEGEEIESITIFNNVGQLIQNITVVSNVNKINTKAFSDGLYYLQINTKSGVNQTEKFIITK
jgi:hypothetical protein